METLMHFSSGAICTEIHREANEAWLSRAPAFAGLAFVETRSKENDLSS